MIVCFIHTFIMRLCSFDLPYLPNCLYLRIHRKSSRSSWKTFAHQAAHRLQYTWTSSIQWIRCPNCSVRTNASTDYRCGKYTCQNDEYHFGNTVSVRTVKESTNYGYLACCCEFQPTKQKHSSFNISGIVTIHMQAAQILVPFSVFWAMPNFFPDLLPL